MIMTEIKNRNGKLIYADGTLVFINARTGDTLTLAGGNEFVLYLENEEGEICILNDRAFVCRGAELCDEGFCIAYTREDLTVTVVYTTKTETFEKTLFIEAEREISIKRVCLENRRSSAPVTRGGEGQPAFLGAGQNSSMWCGIEFPAANNAYEGNTLCFTQAPFERTTDFRSLPVVYGIDTCGDLFGSFAAYIKSKAIKKQSTKIYCDWGLHDDMTEGDAILTAQLTLDNIERITKLSEKSGVKFDYYLMDAFWFEQNTPYDRFKKSTFPDGSSPIAEAIERAGMKYGLWFDINFIKAEMQGMEKYDTLLHNGSLCFACDEIAELMTKGIETQIRECGLKMLKLDFAYFECKNPAHGHSVELTESKEKAVKNFLRMMKKLKAIEPELKVLCYNGWTTSLDWIGSVRARNGYAISPYWSQYIDYLYCGDPRPSEIACGDLEKSLVWYTDAMIRNFADSAMPLDCIDDHGTMLGCTGTIYRLGKKLFRQGVLMDVMRGGKKLHLYGDTSGLDDDDCKFFGYVNDVYDKAMEKGYDTYLIGGDARKGQIYGYSATNGAEGYVVLVNPTPVKTLYPLALSQWKNIRVKATVRIADDALTEKNWRMLGGVMPLELSAYGYVCIEWLLVDGEKSFDKVMLLPSERLVLDLSGKKVLQLTFTKDGSPLRTCYGLPEGFKALADGKELTQNVTTDIWSGVSWLHYELNGEKMVTLVYEGKENLTLKYYAEEEIL